MAPTQTQEYKKERAKKKLLRLRISEAKVRWPGCSSGRSWAMPAVECPERVSNVKGAGPGHSPVAATGVAYAWMQYRPRGGGVTRVPATLGTVFPASAGCPSCSAH